MVPGSRMCARYQEMHAVVVDLTLATSCIYLTHAMLNRPRYLNLVLSVIAMAACVNSDPVIAFFPRVQERTCFSDKRVIHIILLTQGITLFIAGILSCGKGCAIADEKLSLSKKKGAAPEVYPEMVAGVAHGVRAICLVSLAFFLKAVEDWSYRRYLADHVE